MSSTGTGTSTRSSHSKRTYLQQFDSSLDADLGVLRGAARELRGGGLDLPHDTRYELGAELFQSLRQHVRELSAVEPQRQGYTSADHRKGFQTCTNTGTRHRRAYINR
jgi:hypothetical protein